jgi:hypothetical protein
MDGAMASRAGPASAIVARKIAGRKGQGKGCPRISGEAVHAFLSMDHR